MTGMHIGKAALAALGIAGLAGAAYCSLRIGYADWLARPKTAAATQAALHVVPEQSEYWYRLGLLAADDAPETATKALERAVALNPADANSWIELGLQAESRGSQADAERYLLRAATEDRQFTPRWSLANFYYRQNQQDSFWTWAKSSATMLSGDPRPLFRLCNSVSEDVNLVDRLEIRDPAMRVSYLWYLTTLQPVTLLAPVAIEVASSRRAEDTPALLAACDRLIQPESIDDAVRLWNALSAGRRIPFPPLDAAGGPVSTNSGFATPPSLHGFDWRVASLKGVSTASEDSGPGLRVSLSGDQPVNCELLAQLIPARPGANYQLEIAYRTANIAPKTGLTWVVSDVSNKVVLFETESLSSAEETRQAFPVTAPPGCRLLRLSLVYTRALGTTRIEGSATLLRAGLKLIS